MKNSTPLIIFAFAVCTAPVAAQYVAQELPTQTGFGQALGAGGGQVIGGSGYWQGLGYDKLIDLRPPGFDTFGVLGVGGGNQVGYARVDGGIDHALVWSAPQSNTLTCTPRASSHWALLPGRPTASTKLGSVAEVRTWGALCFGRGPQSP
ncbi:MAG: hypothetical protein ACR2HJ_04435 [Fimbriimonadales bacterium]